MSEITGEYWIIDGSIEYADGDNGDKNHEMIAYEHIAREHLVTIYNFAKSLNMKIPSLASIEYSEHAESAVHGFLTAIKKNMLSEKDPNNSNLPLYKNDNEIFEKIRRETKIDKEELSVLIQGVYFGASLDPRVVVMKKYGWIVLRNNNVEVYGYNDQKRKEIVDGIEEVLDQEGIDDNDEEVELSLFDYKTNRSWDSTLADLKNGGIRATTLPTTTYNKPLMVPTKGLNLAQRQALFTSEAVGFKDWLLLSESKGVIIPEEVKSQIKSSVEKLYQVAKEVKQEPGKEVFDVVTIRYQDPYFKNRPRQVDVHIVNDKHENNYGSFRVQYGIQINVAHVEEKDLTIRWIERVLAHELIHSMDPKLSDFDKFKGVKSYDNSGSMSYYTHPFEFDAYTGQFVYSITTAVEKFKGTDKEPFLRKALDDTLRFISNPEKAKSEKTYGLIADPEYWRYYHIYFLHGSPMQKRKMQQRIYKAVMDAKQQLS